MRRYMRRFVKSIKDYIENHLWFFWSLAIVLAIMGVIFGFTVWYSYLTENCITGLHC